jgi:hypothetical protein
MIINIPTTSRRREHYLPQVMEALEASGYTGQINLIAGDAQTDYLQPYSDRCTIVPWDKPHLTTREDCAQNHARALAYGDGPALHLEDDVLLAPDWYARLQDCIAQIPEETFILDLCKSRYFTSARFLLGAQALYYSTGALRQALTDYITAHIGTSTADVLIGGGLVEQGGYYYVADPAIAQHIGRVSTFSYSGRVVP